MPVIAARKNYRWETEATDLRRALTVAGSADGSVAESVEQLVGVKTLASFGSAVMDSSTTERDEALDRLTEEVRLHFDVAWSCVGLVDLE